MGNICDPGGTVVIVPFNSSPEQIKAALEDALYHRMMEATHKTNPKFKDMARLLAAKIVAFDDLCDKRFKSNPDLISEIAIGHPTAEECEVFGELEKSCHLVEKREKEKEKPTSESVYHYLKVHVGKLYSIIVPGAGGREWVHTLNDVTTGRVRSSGGIRG